jgi:hypothetical protein
MLRLRHSHNDALLTCACLQRLLTVSWQGAAAIRGACAQSKLQAAHADGLARPGLVSCASLGGRAVGIAAVCAQPRW